MKCISLDPDDNNYLEMHISTWYCKLCVSQIFPFNHVEDDELFISDINHFDISLKTLDSISECIFNPFELNTDKYYSPLCDIDLDINFYNEIDYHLVSHCNYYMDNHFTSAIKNKFGNVSLHDMFSLCHIDIRSLKANLPAFESCLGHLEMEVSVIGMSETWLQDCNCNLYNVAGYNLIENHRSTKKGGGVAIFLKQGISYQNRNDLKHMGDIYESVFIEIDKDAFSKDNNVIIGVIYRPPGTDLEIFNEHINILLNKLKNDYKFCYLKCDSNVNLLNYGKNRETTDFVDALHSNSFVSLINRPTRVNGDSATLIDNIFTNCFSNIHDTFQCLIQTDISDHFPIIHVDGSVKQANIDTYILRRNMSQRNKHDFLCAMSNVDWSSIHSEMCTQGAFSLFHSTLVNHYNKHFPMQKIKLKYNCRKPWLTQGLKDAIKVKNKLYKKYQKINAVAHEIAYKTYRNKLNHILKCAERKHYSDLLNDNKNNVKRTWQILKSIVNKNKTTKFQDKFKLSDGTFTSDKSMISTKFNEFFIGIGPNLAQNIQRQSVTPLSLMGQSWVNSIYLHEVTSEEIIKILQSLKNGAAGYDGINASTLKLVSSLIVNPLRYICNLSLIEGVFPTELKIANVLPLYKSDDPFCFNNYRPVSLLCVLSKVFEKFMYNRLLNFLEEHKFFVNEQFGFRKSHSSYMALMTLMDKLIESLDKGEYIMGIFLDFSKAFDTVDHEILLKKLYHYGIRGSAYDWFYSYLSDRKQYVTYNGFSSATKCVTCGVPQGSILGPLLFLIYINDRCGVCEYTTPILFADDTNLFCCGNYLGVMEKKVNSELTQISTWLKVNKLSLNVKKTHYMVFTRKKRQIRLNIKIDGHSIAEVQDTKFLGVYIDNKLNWKKHTSYLASKISKGIGMIIKARHYLNKMV